MTQSLVACGMKRVLYTVDHEQADTAKQQSLDVGQHLRCVLFIQLEVAPKERTNCSGAYLILHIYIYTPST